MILPTKHLRLSNTLLSTGAILLINLEKRQTVTQLWERTRTQPEVRTFDRFSLGLDFLFMLGVVDFHEGLVRRLG